MLLAVLKSYSAFVWLVWSFAVFMGLRVFAAKGFKGSVLITEMGESLRLSIPGFLPIHIEQYRECQKNVYT